MAELNTACGWKFEQRIPSEPDVCAQIIATLLEQLERTKWSNKDIFGIHMAVEEAILNAIHHGNKCSPTKDVHLMIKICDKEFYASVTDQGSGFDPDEVPDPTAEENLENASGRGVMLIKNFVDEVVYNAKGNSVELRKLKTV